MQPVCVCKIEWGVKSREQTSPNLSAISAAACLLIIVFFFLFNSICLCSAITLRWHREYFKSKPSGRIPRSLYLLHQKPCVSRSRAVALIKFSQRFQRCFCAALPQVKLMHFSRSITGEARYSRSPAAAVGGPPPPPRPSPPPFEVRPGQEPINTEESHVSENALSGGRRSQLRLGMLAHPHLCTAQDLKLGRTVWDTPRGFHKANKVICLWFTLPQRSF